MDGRGGLSTAPPIPPLVFTDGRRGCLFVQCARQVCIEISVIVLIVLLYVAIIEKLCCIVINVRTCIVIYSSIGE